jgi:hypothetical protein
LTGHLSTDIYLKEQDNIKGCVQALSNSRFLIEGVGPEKVEKAQKSKRSKSLKGLRLEEFWGQNV